MSNKHVVKGEGHAIVDEVISWVGDCPWTGTLGFGTESGSFMSLTRSAKGDRIGSIQIAHDSVNGAAFSGEIAAFTSRQSILVAKQARPGHIEVKPLLERNEGAHGVVAASSGEFLLPLGPSGILIACGDVDANEISCRRAQLSDNPFNAYRLILVGQDDGRDVFALAARGQGVFAFTYAGKWLVSHAVGHHFSGRDIVDVCPASVTGFPLGVLGLTREREVFFIPNVLRHNTPGMMSYPELTGSAYGIHSVDGHLFILTNRELVSIPGAVDQLSKSRFPTSQKIASMPTQASDLFVGGDNKLYLIDDSFVLELSPAALVGEDVQHATTNQTQEVESDWLDTVLEESDSSWAADEHELQLLEFA